MEPKSGADFPMSGAFFLYLDGDYYDKMAFAQHRGLQYKYWLETQ